MWNEHSSWESAEQAWDKNAQEAAKEHPIKGLAALPSMVGITPDTAKNLKWKSLKWMILQDDQWKIMKNVLKHPLRYGWNYIISLFKSRPYTRDQDFFHYNIKDVQEFRKLLEDKESVLVVGFSYCQKPFECPSGRFTDQCIHAKDNPVCQQCSIGKVMHALPEKHTVPLIIPTIHYIGGKIFDTIAEYPGKQILFMITACEMTLQMFGDWGNMVKIKGLGIRLDGRICNTMKAFELSEKGIKPGLTVILTETQKKVLELVRHRRESLTNEL